MLFPHPSRKRFGMDQPHVPFGSPSNWPFWVPTYRITGWNKDDFPFLRPVVYLEGECDASQPNGISVSPGPHACCDPSACPAFRHHATFSSGPANVLQLVWFGFGFVWLWIATKFKVGSQRRTRTPPPLFEDTCIFLGPIVISLWWVPSLSDLLFFFCGYSFRSSVETPIWIPDHSLQPWLVFSAMGNWNLCFFRMFADSCTVSVSPLLPGH